LTDTSSQQTNTSSIPPSSSMELQPRKSRETPDLTKPKSIIQTKQEDTKKGRKQGGGETENCNTRRKITTTRRTNTTKHARLNKKQKRRKTTSTKLKSKAVQASSFFYCTLVKRNGPPRGFPQNKGHVDN
jgi:hypothetical protein